MLDLKEIKKAFFNGEKIIIHGKQFTPTIFHYENNVIYYENNAIGTGKHDKFTKNYRLFFCHCIKMFYEGLQVEIL